MIGMITARPTEPLAVHSTNKSVHFGHFPPLGSDWSCREEHLHLNDDCSTERNCMRTLFVVGGLLALIGTTAQAEIMCTERGGCWETGKQIRLIQSRQETSVPSRDGKGTTRIIGIADDMPGQTYRPAPVRRR